MGGGGGSLVCGPVTTVKAPGSSANLGPGFDALGVALTRHAWVSEIVVDGRVRVRKRFGYNFEGRPTECALLELRDARKYHPPLGYAPAHVELRLTQVR